MMPLRCFVKTLALGVLVTLIIRRPLRVR